MIRISTWGLLACLFFSTGCKSEHKYVLQPANEYKEYVIDAESELSTSNLYTFEDHGKEYLTFPVHNKRAILIYDLVSGKLVHNFFFNVAPPRGIGTELYGYYVKDLGHIYVPDFNEKAIYETDTTGVFKKTIKFSVTDDGLKPMRALYNNLHNVQLTFIGNKLYIPQQMNANPGNSCVEKSPIGITVDTVSGDVCKLPMNFPSLIASKELRNCIEGSLPYSETFDGKRFIYSFSMDENLYVVSPDHQKIQKIKAKSSDIPELKFRKIPSDFSKTLKTTCEMATYGNIIYDKYRQVYYRFAYPESKLADNEDYLKILNSGKKEFSIIILDKNFHILGETKFPPFTYLPHIFFISKDGLYLSVNHFKRNDFCDWKLRFQKIELIKQ
jgi:hypothetical protein